MHVGMYADGWKDYAGVAGLLTCSVFICWLISRAYKNYMDQREKRKWARIPGIYVDPNEYTVVEEEHEFFTECQDTVVDPVVNSAIQTFHGIGAFFSRIANLYAEKCPVLR